ncbi:MAG: amidohydrolase [Bacteroidota bacterium]
MPEQVDGFIDEQWISPWTDPLTQLRQSIHQRPETAFQEHQTAQRIQKFLKEHGADQLDAEIGGTGIVATYNAAESGPVTMIRAELDGLPIQERETPLTYRSQTDGKMHACGHDGHMTTVAGVGAALSKLQLQKGMVKLLFQPAEETGEGALAMLEDGAFKNHVPDYIYGLHNLPGYPMHQVIIREDVFASASVGMKIHLEGATAHAAHPEEGRSPAQAVSQLIPMIESLPQRATSLEQTAKATVIHTILGEEAFGTSPGTAKVMATLRSYQNSTLQEMQHRMEKEAQLIAEAHGLACRVEWTEPFAATTCNAAAVETIRQAAEVNELAITKAENPFAWSEDFGQFTNRFDGAFFGLGSGVDQPPLHASDYDFPDELISTGVRLFLSIIAQHNGLQERN